MKKAVAALTLALALSGCATIERSAASYILGRYIGVWQKQGATDNDLAQASTICIFQQQIAHSHDPRPGVAAQPFLLDQLLYRSCMESQGWKLVPFKL